MKEFNDKLDRILDEQTATKVEMTAMRKDLNYHIRRTDILEEALQAEVSDLEDAVEPLTRLYNFLKVGAALLTSLAALAAVIKLILP